MNGKIKQLRRTLQGIIDNISRKVRDLVYDEDNGTIYIVIILWAVNKLLWWQFDVGFGALEYKYQFVVVGFLASFVVSVEIWGAEKVINMLYNPRMKALLELNPDHEGRFDVLVGQEDTVEEEYSVVGDEELHEKPAGPSGQANVAIARKLDHQIGEAVATWRALFDPLEVEETEAYIEANNYLLQNEIDEKRQLQRRLLVFKNRASKSAFRSTQKEWDDKHSDDDEISFDALMDESIDDYDPEEFDVEGVKEERREELDEQKRKKLEEQEEQADASSGESEGDNQ